MNLLVTGAAGYIGSYVRTLLAPEAADALRITVPDRLTYAGTLDNLELDHPRLESAQGAVRAAELVDTRAWWEPLTWARRTPRHVMTGPVTVAGGIPHPTDSGESTRYDPAREAFRLRGAGTDRVRPVGSEASGPHPAPPCTKPFHGSARSPLRETP
jgi:nucleoside-diphosphate-sugar epimerase